LINDLTYLTFAVIEKFISTRKTYERCCSHFDEFEARTLVWKPNVKANDLFGCVPVLFLKKRTTTHLGQFRKSTGP